MDKGCQLNICMMKAWIPDLRRLIHAISVASKYISAN